MSEKKRRWFQIHLSTAIMLMFVAGGLVGVGVWGWKQYKLRITPELERMDSADPVADLNDALQVGDYRFVCVAGYELTTPGVSDLLPKKYGKKEVRGTTDCFKNNEQERLQQKAYAYAREYNRLLLQHISAKERQLQP